MAIIGSYSLVNRCKEQRPISVSIYTPIEDRHIEAFERQWKPILQQRKSRCRRMGDSVERWQVEDAHWSWKGKQRDYAAPNFYTFAVEAEAKTEGLMLCDIDRNSRIEKTFGKGVVYVEYLQTAPWNRRVPDSIPCVKGIGSLLMGVAISLSKNLGYEGRVTLHALPQAESWYRDICGMYDLGPDVNYGKLTYFEMTSERADEFLS